MTMRLSDSVTEIRMVPQR